VQHDNTVTWLARWKDNITDQYKYMYLDPSSSLNGRKDWEKYEKARRLGTKITKIREDYMEDMKSTDMRVRQRAVAMYFIDRLALRAGNDKEEDEADTVGCCSLRVEHVELHEQLNKKKHVVELDFLGKDSIRYHNEVPVPEIVFENVRTFKFMEDKKVGDELFDINPKRLNSYLNNMMHGLTAKVFRTYNACVLQEQMLKKTDPDANVKVKMSSYNQANTEVGGFLNHQRSVSQLRTHRCTIALDTSKLNYLDPRISVAWCKRHEVPIKKVYNKAQREKFRWAISMIMDDDGEEYHFGTIW